LAILSAVDGSAFVRDQERGRNTYIPLVAEMPCLHGGFKHPRLR